MEDQGQLFLPPAQVLLFLFKSQKTIARYGCWLFNRQLLLFFRKEPQQHNKQTHLNKKCFTPRSLPDVRDSWAPKPTATSSPRKAEETELLHHYKS